MDNTTPRISDYDKRLWEEITRDVTPLHPSAVPQSGKEIPASIPSRNLSYHSTSLSRSPARYPVYDRSPVEMTLDRFDSNTLRLIRLRKLAIDRTVDLHDRNLEQAYQLFYESVQHAYHTGERLLLVITGKGGVEHKGVLRKALPRWCREPAFSPMIIAIHKAHPQDGGDGAYYIRIKRYGRQ